MQTSLGPQSVSSEQPRSSSQTVLTVLHRIPWAHSEFWPPGQSATSERSRHSPCAHQLPAWQDPLVVHASPQPSRKTHSRVLASHSSFGWHWPDDEQLSQNSCAVQIFPVAQSSRLTHSGGRPESTFWWVVLGHAQSATARAERRARLMAGR